MDEAIVQYGREKNFHPHTLERWVGLPEEDRAAVWEVVSQLKMGENHLRDLLDWLEEVALRDRASPRQILKQERLGKILSDPRLGRNDKLKRFKEELHRIRFPKLSRIEIEIQKRIRAMKLGPRIQIAVPPGLGEGVVTVRLRAARYEELRTLLSELARAAEGEPLKEIFDLLQGKDAT